MLPASLFGETASRARSAFNNNPAKAKTVTAAQGQRGDAGAVFDLASKLRFGAEPASRTDGVMAGEKKAKKTT